MQLMARYPDKHFELAIVDPPYGLNIARRNGSIGQRKGQGRITRYRSKKWDAAVPGREYFDELFRVSQHQIIFGANYFTNFLPPAKGWIVWDKRQSERVTFAMAELVYSSINRSIKIFSCSKAFIGNRISKNIRLAKAAAKIHPTQKPVLLYEWLLHHYANTGDKILDTHLGSGSLAIACINRGYDVTACEIDEEYYKAASVRIAEQTSQQQLFANTSAMENGPVPATLLLPFSETNLKTQ